MKRYNVFVAAFLCASALATAAAGAKTLVYCSEGSPENFYPGDQHHRHLVRRRRARSTTSSSISSAARTKVVPGPRREAGTISADGTIYHLPPAQGREVPLHQGLQADPRLQRRRRHLHRSSGSGRRTIRTSRSRAATYATSTTWACRSCSKSIEKVDDYTVKITLNKPEAPFLANLAMDFAGDPVEGICRRDAEGRHAGEVRPGAGRHRPVLARAVPEGRGHPLQGVPGLLGRQGARSTTSSSRSRRMRRSAGPSCRRANATSCRIRTRPTSTRCKKDPNVTGARAAGPERRLPRLQHDEEAVRRRARAPGPQHGDQQEGDHRRASIWAPAWRRRTRSRRRSGPTTTRSRTIRTIRRRPRSCWPRPASERLRDRPVGDAGAAALQPERQAHRRADAGRPRQGRRQGRDQDLRVGRVPQARCRRASTRWACSAGPATTAIRTTSSIAARLRLGARAGGQNVAKWCNKAFDDLVHEGEARSPTRASAPSSTSRRR